MSIPAKEEMFGAFTSLTDVQKGRIIECCAHYHMRDGQRSSDGSRGSIRIGYGELKDLIAFVALEMAGVQRPVPNKEVSVLDSIRSVKMGTVDVRLSDVTCAPPRVRLSLQQAIRLLEPVIWVTNKIDASDVPKEGVVIPYYVNCVDAALAPWRRVLLEFWANSYFSYYPDEYSIAGLQRGLLNTNNIMSNDVVVRMQPKYSSEVDRDNLHQMGLNLVRSFVGVGFVLWDDWIWVDGEKLESNRARVGEPGFGSDSASFKALIKRFVLPARN